MPFPFDLQGRKALVTGASRGIGRAISLALARAGAEVALLARGADELDKLAREIDDLGVRAVPIPTDVTVPAQVERAVDTALAEFGQLDVVVNNAGGTGRFGPFLSLPHSAWEQAMRLNFDSAVHVCRAVGPHLTGQRGGSVVNVASFAGQGGLPLLAPYAAAKAALISLTRSLAAEWAVSDVRVNAVVPGWVATDLTAPLSADPATSASLLEAVPAGRWGRPEDVAGAVVYLAGDASGLATGSCLTLDGGLSVLSGGPATLRFFKETSA
ncbi:3-oxoacyl-[acyl-carrier protein] reductase [Thermomonospora echinospora]|uniref:3-oxoacyl-[acyl-carrier protein] reductase n=1 Tax=Thermomonospora echinospora TaxID=1992 RepID=A0A1H5TU72_9ACTN|nr:glucose 1-dehydrogenase [Thermomonospora echinospora]SEF66310.1 3-oxoacyl-[acyl-carrier protein] reductase [Thermomonospora echinospora]